MTVKKSPSDNGDCQEKTEHDTFLALKKITYGQLKEKIDAHKDRNNGEISSNDYDDILEGSGWTRDDFIKELFRELDDTMTIMEESGW